LYLNADCDIEQLTSTTTPTSVHALKPGDIKYIGALGDSLTVGNFYKTCIELNFFISEVLFLKIIFKSTLFF